MVSADTSGFAPKYANNQQMRRLPDFIASLKVKRL